MMSMVKKILLLLACFVLVLVSWVVAINVKTETDIEKQNALVTQADKYLEDEIYLYGLPLLLQAAGYQTENTREIEKRIKDIYREQGNVRSYTELLSRIAEEDPAEPALYMELADYYLTAGDYKTAMSHLRRGLEKTDDSGLSAMYETHRYAYSLGKTLCEDLTLIASGHIQARRDGFWGLLNTSGSVVLPFQYDRVSTMSDGFVVVQKGGVVETVNAQGLRAALYKGEADGFSNLSENLIGIYNDGQCTLHTGTFQQYNLTFEEIGMFSKGHAAVKQDGKWGVFTMSGEYFVPCEYDGIVQDELSRCYAQNAVFVQEGGSIYLYTTEGKQSTAYEDAHIFINGWAAVKREGKWGFINASGEEMLAFVYDDARSFGNHLAAVCKDGLWGYINTEGKMVIEAQFWEARDFSGATAPVRTEAGWVFLSLDEY